MCKKWVYFIFVAAVFFATVPAGAVLLEWENAVAPASPVFFATNVPDGLYDIGMYGGEQTYEFVVKSNPDETEASMCLIGRRDFGDTQAGLKFEQWNNTGTYGATLFGVVDLDFGVANNPGVETHLVFVSSEATGTTALYVNGVYQASVDAAVSLSGPVGIGAGAQDEATRGSAFFDNFDGDIYGVAIYDGVLSDEEIKAHSDAYFRPEAVVPSTAGLVASYPLDNDANDVSGNGNNGTLSGDPQWVAGKVGGALEFNGVDDHVDCGNDASLDITGPLTMGAWVYPIGPGSSSYPRIVDKSDGTGGADPGYKMYLRPNDGYLVTLSAGGEFINSTNAAVLNEWNYVAFVTDGIQRKLYLNGTWEVWDINAVPVSAANPLYLGDSPAGSRPLNGRIDEVNIYNRGLSDGEVLYLSGHRTPYTYDGDAAVAGPANDHDSLDGSWDHNNGSDAWDGSGIGEGAPGGASALVEDDVTFLRIQDTGDPRGMGFSDPSNRKIYFTRQTGIGLDSARLEVRIRVATSAPLDNMGTEPWPAGGIGYHIRDNGKGMFGISDGAGIISFSLAKAGEPDFENVATDVLVMNNLVGAEPSGDVDTGDAATAVNMLTIDDATQWNTFVIDIAPGGAGTHVVTISANGGPEQTFEVTEGTGTEDDVPYITLGSSGTGGTTAFDVDYISIDVTPPASAEVDPTLSIYYTFDEVGDVVPDQSGKGHDGAVVGDVTAVAEGVLAGAAQLANTGYLDLDGPNFPAEEIPTSGLTLAAWTNIDGTSSQNAIFNARASDATWLIHPEIRPGNGDYRFTVRKYGGVTIGNINGGTPGYKQPEGTPVPNEWVHVAMTFSRADAQVILYVNGEVVAEDAITEDADMAGDWGMGARVGYNIDDARHYTGLMDEFHLFTRALSQDEIVKMAGL